MLSSASNPKSREMNSLELSEQKTDREHVVTFHLSESKTETIYIDLPTTEPPEEKEVATPARLQHLQIFDEHEIKTLENRYGKPRQELEFQISQHHGRVWAERVLNWVACSSGFLIIFFTISTSNKAFVSSIQIFSPDTTPPDDLTKTFSYPISILSLGLFGVVFSCHKEAVKSVLEYANAKSWSSFLRDSMQALQNSPMKTGLHTAKYVFDQSCMFLMNTTAAMSQVIYVAQPLLKWPAPVNWMSILGIIYFGNRFYVNYFNRSYLDGMDYVWKLLRGEKKHGDFVTTLETALQGLSSIGLRVYPYYYFLAAAADNALGWWFPPVLICAAAAFNGIGLLYPSAHKYYFEDRDEIEKLLLETYQELPETERDAAIAARRSALEAEIREQFGRFYLLKNDKTVSLLVAYDAFIGGYFGYELGALCPPPSIAASAIFGVFFSSVFGVTLYLAEEIRVMNKLVRGKLENKPDNTPREPLTFNEKLASFASNVINVTSSISNVTSIVGTAASLIAGIPILNSLIALIAVKKGLNNIKFNGDKFSNTIKGSVPKGNVFSSMHACFFKPAERAVVNEEPIHLSPCGRGRRA